jgi:EAL domain-containing protein (putative c-di-GMP-specific phosphodiesterase class I)
MAAQDSATLTATELERALDRGDLVAVYQPCYDLRTGALVAVEALARIRDPLSGELRGPASFIETAEASGLVGRLDRTMMEQAFDRLAAWRDEPGSEGLCVAINVSPADLDDPHLADRIAGAAERAGIPLDAVIVELTETLLSDAERGHDRVLAAISDLGCNVTLDDFGTGNASFAYLLRFRVDGIKIDRSFVQLLGSGGTTENVAESLVRFCLSLGVHVVAEGIEEPSQVEALRRLGCPFGQGFLMGRPATADDLDLTPLDWARTLGHGG